MDGRRPRQLLELVDLEAWRRRTPFVLVGGLLVIDMMFVVVHFVRDESRGSWALGREWGVPEMFGYAQGATTAIVLALVYAATRQRSFLAIAAVVTVVVIDDAFAFHEGVGARLAEAVDELPGGIRVSDVGEIAAFGILGLACLLLLGWAYRAGGRDAREAVVVFAGLFLLLGFCAVVFDALHVAAPDGRVAALFSAGEDGGEMVALSLMVGAAVATRRLTASTVSTVPPTSRPS